MSVTLYRLINLKNHSVISVSKDKYKIGRANNNDFSIPNNRYLSSTHCMFEYDEGELYIKDLSTNGTLLNKSQKLPKNMRILVKSGDSVQIVYREDDPQFNIVLQIDNAEAFSDEDSLNTTQLVNNDTPIYEDSQPSSSDDQKENNYQLAIVTTTVTEEEKKKSNDVEPKPVNNREFEMTAGTDMEKLLICACCQDIIQNPLSLEPCLHTFCSGCFHSWEAIQRTCPQCRQKVIGKKKNFLVNDMIEIYLKSFPDKRPEPRQIEIVDLNNKNNEVGRDGFYLDYARVERENEDDEDDEDMDDEDIDEDLDEEDDDGIGFRMPIAYPGHFPPCMMLPARAPAQINSCRQCSTNLPLHPIVAGVAAATSVFKCALGQKHILCQCCIHPMPDRRGEQNISQQCTICNQFYCNMYWKCNQANCKGCLNPLRQYNFAPQHLVNLVNNNVIETQVLQTYLTSKNMLAKDLLIACCDSLDQKLFQCTGIDPNIAVPSEKVVCYQCGLKMFKELAYQYRSNISHADIEPANMRERENCHWGRNCRTQYSKVYHAQKFNHCCEQIRFQ